MKKVESFSELKHELGINTMKVSWNDEFPSDDLYYTIQDEELKNCYDNFLSVLYKSNKKFYLNQIDMKILGDIAYAHGILLSYFSTRLDEIELFVYKYIEKEQWFDIFKSLVSKKLFFNSVNTFINCIRVDTLSDNIYQYTPSKIPQSYSVKTSIIENKYLLITYISDFYKPEYRVVKFDKLNFITFIPKVSLYDNKFDCVKFEFDDKVFIGDSIKTLRSNGIQSRCETLRLILNGKEYNLYSSKGCIETPNNIIPISGFRRSNNIAQVYMSSFIIDNKKVPYVVLNNGFLWIPDNYSMIDLKDFIDFDVNSFQLSSKENGIVLMRNNLIELLSIEEFEKLLIKKFLI